ncbi:unnamed protein product [Ixodes pacificus]
MGDMFYYMCFTYSLSWQVFDFKLNPEEMKAIDKFNRNHRFLLLPWAQEHKHYPFNIEF